MHPRSGSRSSVAVGSSSGFITRPCSARPNGSWSAPWTFARRGCAGSPAFGPRCPWPSRWARCRGRSRSTRCWSRRRRIRTARWAARCCAAARISWSKSRSRCSSRKRSRCWHWPTRPAGRSGSASTAGSAPRTRSCDCRLRELPADRIRSLEFDLYTDPRRWDAIARPTSDPEARGGLIDDLASHQLDLVPWLLRRPVEAVCARYLRREPGTSVVEIGLRLGGGLEARCRAGHGTRQLERVTVDLGDQLLVATPGGLLATSRALAPLAGRRLAASAAADAMRRRLTRRPKATVETIRRQHADWAAAVRGGKPPIGAAADGLAGARCVALTDAARHSLAGGGAWVSISPPGAP